MGVVGTPKLVLPVVLGGILFVVVSNMTEDCVEPLSGFIGEAPHLIIDTLPWTEDAASLG